MEISDFAHLSIPSVQIVALLCLSTVTLLFGRVRLALLINYVFTLYWGYFTNRDLLLPAVESFDYFTLAYFGFGLTMALFAMIGFMVHQQA